MGFNDLKSTRKGVHNDVNVALESAAKAADVAVNQNGKNFSDHLDSAKAVQGGLEGKLDELATKRQAVSKIREEQRRVLASSYQAAQHRQKSAVRGDELVRERW